MPNAKLTKREIEILRDVSEGKYYKQIGDEHTIRNQMSLIYLKLGANNQASAVAMAIRAGII